MGIPYRKQLIEIMVYCADATAHTVGSLFFCLRVSVKERHSRFFEFKRTFVGSSSPDQASRMATPSVEREQTDQETPRTVPETQRDLVRRLLGEVSEMRKENQQLQSEVATLKANVTKRRLFRQPKDNDPECSVSYFFS